MKKIALTFAIAFISIYTFAQLNLSNIEHKCSHQPKESIHHFYNTGKSSLMSNYDVKFYKLDIEAERDTTAISGNVIIHAKATSATLDTFAFDLISSANVDSVYINNIKQNTIIHTGDEVFVPLSTPVSNGNFVTAQIFYRSIPTATGFFSGITSATSSQWGNDVTWTLSEPFNAKEWWPCKQELKDKAESVYIFVTTNSDNMVGSNGLLTAVVNLPNNKKRYEWKSNYPIDYYLISIAVAKYIDYSFYAYPAGTQDSILIQNFIYDNPSCLSSVQNDVYQTKPLIETFSDLFSLYPFINEKYGHCLTELGGGMEHQTMTTLGGFSFWLVAHELGHMWWGDNVTCATWQDIWINEGFASYSEYLAYQYLKSQNDADNWMRSAMNYVMSQPDGSVFIPAQNAEDVWRIFNSRLSYKKGAVIIHMIRFELQNDSLLFATFHNFQNQFKDSVATGLDFKSVLENTSGMNFTDFFNQWYFGEGFPTYNILWQQINDTLFFTSTQTTSTTTTPLFKMLMEYKINYSGGDTIIKVYQTANINGYAIPFIQSIDSINVDPNNWVLNQVGSIITGIEDFTNPLYFSFGPNPCSDVLNIFTTKPCEISIYDITGRLVHRVKSNNKHTNVNTETFRKGLYLIKASDGKHSYSGRFIKGY